MKAAKRLDKFHTLLRDEQIYCEKYGEAAPTKITHSAVKCALCGGVLAGLRYVGGEFKSNPWTGKPELILWGYHKSISYVPVKLSEFSKSEQKRREKEGWKTAVYAKGDEPIGLIAQARREAAKDLMKNPVPSYAMILRRKLAKGHNQEEAEELARRELQQANIFLSEGRKKNPIGFPHLMEVLSVAKEFGITKQEALTIIRKRDKAIRERGYGPHATLRKILKDRRTFKKNPVCKNGPVKIYGQTEKIFMKKTAGPYKGQKFVHDFKGGVRQIGMPRGTVVKFPDGRTARLTTRSVLLDGKKDLWRNFAA